MKLFFDHVLFQQTNFNFNHTLVSAVFEESEFDYALSNGWFPDNFWMNPSTQHSIRCRESGEFVWSPIRSARIYVANFVLDKKDRRLLKNNITVEVKQAFKVNNQELFEVYLKYIKIKQFEDYKENLDSFNLAFCRDDFQFLEYRQNNNLIGFCLVQPLGSSLISYQFCWDYENPKLSLGKFSQIKEVEYAKSLKLDYVYIGCIAENEGFYKSNFPGFEYFTGREWRKKDNLIEKWLTSDSNCHSIKELCQLESEYIKDYNL